MRLVAKRRQARARATRLLGQATAQAMLSAASSGVAVRRFIVAELQARHDDNAAWSAMYDRDIGPFQSKNEKNVEGIKVYYDRAREFHGRGIKMLEAEFAYHPLFKHPGDTFNAVPFAPKKL